MKTPTGGMERREVARRGRRGGWERIDWQEGSLMSAGRG